LPSSSCAVVKQRSVMPDVVEQQVMQVKRRARYQFRTITIIAERQFLGVLENRGSNAIGNNCTAEYRVCCSHLRIFTRELRVASFFTVQSVISDTHACYLIFDVHIARQALVERAGRDDPETVILAGICRNLIRT
jgi:hypothetical protein